MPRSASRLVLELLPAEASYSRRWSLAITHRVKLNQCRECGVVWLGNRHLFDHIFNPGFSPPPQHLNLNRRLGGDRAASIVGPLNPPQKLKGVVN